MTRLKKYDIYKQTGIDWIGEIPEHWEVIRIKYRVNYKKGKNPKELSFEENGKVYLSMEYLRENPKQLFYVKDFSNFVNVDANEILLLWDGSNAGEFIRSKEGVLSSTMSVLKFEEVNNEFAWYLLKSFERFLKEATIGMGIPHVDGDMFKNQFFVIPSSKEQSSIVSFLDDKTAKLNKLITNKQKLIELLKEERTAIINDAVSGNGKKWERKKLKYLTSKIGSGITPSGGASVYLKEGIPLLRSQNIYSDKLDLSDVAFISEEIYEHMDNSKLKDGDVLLNITGASIGRCYYIPSNFGKGNVNQHVCIIRPINSMIKAEYLHLFLISKAGQELINTGQNGANREGLNFQQIGSFLIPLPNIFEQMNILKFICIETLRLNNTISKIEKEIELLQEYKTALISEVVTGKIKVV